jgi:hypothetical protein
MFLTFGIIGLVLGLACSQHAVGPNHSRIPERGKAQVTARLAISRRTLLADAQGRVHLTGKPSMLEHVF